MKKKKGKKSWFCTECGHESINYLGKCPSCSSWNTFKEALAIDDSYDPLLEQINNNLDDGLPHFSQAIALPDISVENTKERHQTSFSEFDRVLGGGILLGSLILIGGDPGIGKSTLLLQSLDHYTEKGLKTMYITGEESLSQVKSRANRLKINSNIYLLADNDLDNITTSILDIKPQIMVIDSIQAISSRKGDSFPGSPSQIRECASAFLKIAKKMNITTFIVGHITKDGQLAGPKILEHIVDTVLHFEGEKQSSQRILRCLKNRFGTTDEIGIFDMNEKGLADGNQDMFLQNNDNISRVLVPTLYGKRIILLEIQALVGYSTYPNPRRIVNGIEYNRLHQIIAVLEKYLRINLSKHDVYISVIGGLDITDTASDLAVAMAILSASKTIKPEWKTSKLIAFGEIALNGEIRTVLNTESRIKEVEKLGYQHIIAPFKNDNTQQVKHINDIRQFFDMS